MNYQKMEADEVKGRIKEAFKELRKDNILARMNFMCCSSCAGAELNDQAEQKGANGYVFYHKQDEETLQESGTVHIGYSGCEKDNEVNSTKALATKLFKALEKQNLLIHWDGQITTKLEIVGTRD